MLPLGGALRVRLEEWRFDEQSVRALGEGHDSIGVGFSERGIDNIGDLPPRRQPDDIADELAKRQRRRPRPDPLAPRDRYGSAVRVAAQDRFLEAAKPGADLETRSLELVAPYVYVDHFLDSEGEAGDAVIERAGPHAKPQVLEQDSSVGAGGKAGRLPETLPGGGLGGGKAGLLALLARPDLEVALVAGHEVPGIGRELMADGVDQSGWPVKIESLLPAKAVPEQPVEACEMIHVHV